MAFDNLMLRLAAARGKDIPMPTVEGLDRLFREMGPEHAEKVVAMIEEFENVPSNLVGIVKKIWRERKARIASETLQKAEWNVESDEYTTPEEWKLFFAIQEEILLWHSLGLEKYNHEGLTVACDVLEWKRLGCPKTWSPLLDSFLVGFLKVHTGSGKICENYLRTFLKMLQDNRVTKTHERNLSSRSAKDQMKYSHVGVDGLPAATGEHGA